MKSVHFLSAGLYFFSQMVLGSILKFGHRVLKFGIKLKVLIRQRKVKWLKFAKVKIIDAVRSI